jgi:hypothetical protein
MAPSVQKECAEPILVREIGLARLRLMLFQVPINILAFLDQANIGSAKRAFQTSCRAIS